jgi:DNA-binding IclR family transcriptional regulator
MGRGTGRPPAVRSGGCRVAPWLEPERELPVTEQSKTVDAALTVLALLSQGEGRCTAAALARGLGLSRSAIARLLSTLEAHDLARRTGDGWGLGLGLLALATNVEPLLRDAARPALEMLAERFGETALLAVREGDEAVAIDQVVAAGSQIVQVRYRPGARHPLQVAAHGRALLATPDPPGAAPPVVVSEGELEPGVRGVAAPIVDSRGRPIASIGLVAPIHRFPPERAVAEAVRSAAAGVTRGLARRGAGASSVGLASVAGLMAATAHGAGSIGGGGGRALLPADG